MGRRDGRRVAGRVTLWRLRGDHHPPDTGVVFYHLQGKAGTGARYAASELNAVLKQHCLQFVFLLKNGWSLCLYINTFLKLISARVNTVVMWLFLDIQIATVITGRLTTASDNCVGKRQNKYPAFME